MPDKQQIYPRNKDRQSGKAMAPDEDETVAKRLEATEARPEPPVAKKSDATAAAKPQRLSIPAHVKREVWMRDRGRCTFQGVLGEHCGSRFQLEYEHLIPVALGGASTVENVALLCRSHNQHRADLVFGTEWMAQYRETSTASSGGG